MKKIDYQVVSRSDRRALAEFLSKEGQLLLPMLELIEQAELAVDELIDVAGRATIEAVLILSAQQLAGPKHPRQGGRPDPLARLPGRCCRPGRTKTAGPQAPSSPQGPRPVCVRVWPRRLP